MRIFCFSKQSHIGIYNSCHPRTRFRAEMIKKHRRRMGIEVYIFVNLA